MMVGVIIEFTEVLSLATQETVADFLSDEFGLSIDGGFAELEELAVPYMQKIVDTTTAHVGKHIGIYVTIVREDAEEDLAGFSLDSVARKFVKGLE